MGKLNQIIAVEAGIRARALEDITKVLRNLKPEIFNGVTRVYAKKDDADEDLPGESKRVQITCTEVLSGLARQMTELLDVTQRKDWTNCIAKASVTVEGKEIVKDAPVGFLLWLEKQLQNIDTILDHLPILDEGEDWGEKDTSGLYRAAPIKTHRSKKVAKVLTLAQATDKHPAQAQVIQEDIVAGIWHTTKISGAMPKPEKTALKGRITKLIRAVKEAREMANMQEEISCPKMANPLFNYLLGT